MSRFARLDNRLGMNASDSLGDLLHVIAKA
jgi:hypothetical protein